MGNVQKFPKCKLEIGKVEQLESQSSISKSINKALKDEILSLKRNANRNSQYSRQDNVEFSGIPDDIPDKNLESTAIALLKKMDVSVEPRDIVDCHRLPKRKSVIVRFVNRKNAVKAIANGKQLRNNVSDMFSGNCVVYVNRNLIPEYLSLRWKTKQLKQSSYVHEFGVNKRGIWAKMGPESRKKQIEIEEDLQEFLPPGTNLRDFLANV